MASKNIDFFVIYFTIQSVPLIRVYGTFYKNIILVLDKI